MEECGDNMQSPRLCFADSTADFILSSERAIREENEKLKAECQRWLALDCNQRGECDRLKEEHRKVLEEIHNKIGFIYHAVRSELSYNQNLYHAKRAEKYCEELFTSINTELGKN